MTPLFFRDTESPPARALSRPTALRIGLLFGPMAVLLALLRLMEHSILKTVGLRAVGTVLWESVPPPTLVLVLTIALGWWAHKTWPYVRPVWILTGAVILGVGLMLWAKILFPPWLAGWLHPEAFQVLRWDLLMLLALSLAFALVLDRLTGGLRGLSLVLLHVLLPLLLLLPIFELGCIMAMGSPPDWALLSYSLRNLGELAPVIASELSASRIVLLALPLLITLLPLSIERLPKVRRWIDDAGPGAIQPAWQTALIPLPLAFLLLLPPSIDLPPTHRTISYAGMTQSMLDDTDFEPDDLAGLTTSDAPAFDTKSLRFVSTDTTRRFNVVVVILESARSRSVTPYNPTLATTPFLDELARQSLLVENMYAIIPYTNKALVPILAGVYPELTYEIVEAEPGGLPAAGLPALLRPHGYQSAFFTPAILSFENKDKILRNLGFDASYGNAAFDKTGFEQANYFGFEDRVMLEPSLAWVDEATAQNKPFFLSYLTLTAHHPYQVPATRAKKTFAPHDIELNDYLNTLHYTDAFLKDLFEGFEQRGLIDSTLFIILGDHGEAFNEHGLTTHGDIIYDEAIQVPAFVYNPVLFPEARRVSGNRSHIDVMPTVAEALGYRIEGGVFPGVSLLQPVADDRAVYHSIRNGNHTIALRQDSLKFFYYNRRQPMQVYDMRNDPLERIDIAAHLDPRVLKTAELNLLLWRRGVQKVYHQREEAPGPLALKEADFGF